MSSFTRDAIMKAFIRLLSERPFHKITVKDVVTECGINRNSFYYHFQDLPALAEEIGKEACEKIVRRFSSMDDLAGCLNAAVEFGLANRRAILNLYRSRDWDLMEPHLWRLCDHLVMKYEENAFGGRKLTEQDLRLISTHVRCLCYGQIKNWLEQGMPDSVSADIPRICELNRMILTGFLDHLNTP